MVHVRDIFEEFERRGVRILGVTAQDSEELGKYLKFHEFPYPVINDEERNVIDTYGIAQQTDSKFGTIARPTNVIVDPEGIVQYIYVGDGADDFLEDEEMYEVLDRI